MFEILLILFLVISFIYFKNRRIYSAGDKFPGPRALPLLGNSYDFATDNEGIFKKLWEFSKTYDRFFRVWNNGKLYLMLYDPEDVEIILSSNKHLNKTDIYKFLYPWIGEGLISNPVISSWRRHRKIITPTFHFKILHNFLDVFNRNADILCKKLEAKICKGPFDVSKPIKLAALDNICETAMGVNINAQNKSDSDYVKAVTDIINIVAMRFYKVWLMIEPIFKLTKHARVQNNCLRILHGMTDKIIGERRKKLSKQKITEDEDEDEENFYNKKKLAFLDVLLQSEEGSQFTDKELREEVATFMFAGHDTISSGTSFTLYCLAANNEVQEVAYNEQKAIFGDSNRLPTYEDIQEMKYLDQVLKEVQRIYPSVCFIGRNLFEDITLPGNYCVPKGSQVIVNIFALHRNPKVWDNPEEFNPDNFSPEAITSRSPYAYVPFSAGPRNCIGQKYAMLAMKATIGLILRHYKILPSPYPEHKLNLKSEIVLSSTTGIHIQIERRQ